MVPGFFYWFKMGKAQDIIRKHVGNPEGLLGLLDDIVYTNAIRWLVCQLDRAIAGEQQAVEGYRQSGDHQETVNYLQSEIKKLKALRDELNELAHEPDEVEAMKVIDNRYMVTRIEGV